jgi:hypothetical protein
LTALNIGVYKLIGRYRVFEFSQLTLSLILPLLLTLTLGGFVSSIAVVIWALVTPMGAIVYSSRRMSIFWFVAFLGVVIDSSLDHANSVLAWARRSLFDCVFLVGVFREAERYCLRVGEFRVKAVGVVVAEHVAFIDCCSVEGWD